jgi:hypothetical protein
MMADIQSAKWLYIKGGLFILGGLLAGTLVILECPSVKVAGLLLLCVWCFARAYYFAFYVIEHYIDPGFRYAGLTAFLKYLVRGKRT